MHETSLGGTIRDYLTGEDVPETTYEEVRQALARMLVQEHGYPKDRLASKVGVYVTVDNEPYCRVADLVLYNAEREPLLVMLFCSGDPGTYDRETVAAARLIEGGPAPLAIATDTRDAVLLDVRSGNILARGMDAIPHYRDLETLTKDRVTVPLEGKRRQAEERILYAYSEFLTSCCEGTCCPIPKQIEHTV